MNKPWWRVKVRIEHTVTVQGDIKQLDRLAREEVERLLDADCKVEVLEHSQPEYEEE